MSVGGTGIPRLQDLSYIEVAARLVAEGATFEQVRQGLVGQAAQLDRDGDLDGSFDQQRWDRVRQDGTKHVYNTVDVLKELMRLGWLEKHVLPSAPSSAYAHADTTYALTGTGRAWADLVVADRRAAYNQLVGDLSAAHPQFKGYLNLVGALPTSANTQFTVPVFRAVAGKHATNTAILSGAIDYAAEGASSGTLGWSATREALDDGIRSYVERIETRMHARKKEMTRKHFLSICNEAISRVAFQAADCPIDYTSMELLRRWTRMLGLANFSYYAPGPNAMRLWATATVTGSGSSATINRRVGSQVRADVLDVLWAVWQELRAGNTSAMYDPIWRVRAAVCWRQRINDDEFDRAIAEVLAGEHPDLPYDIHLDQASSQATPASTGPLVIYTTSGVRRVFHVINIAPKSLNRETA